MLFSSYVFVLLFLPATLAGFELCARTRARRASSLWLVLASLVFYGWWKPTDLLVLCASIAGNNAAFRVIARPEFGPKWRSAVLWTALAANLGVLAYCKYLASLLGALNAPLLAGLVPDRASLPLGISFFTFTQIGLLLDARQDNARACGLLDHALFVTFFPHLIAGPLLHHGDMMPQFASLRPRGVRGENLAVGSAIFIIGLAKKALCADQLAATANAAFAHPGALTTAGAWQGALAYSLQLYFDFSGYSDMAIGIARMFGIRFPANFASPYKAQSVIEYWQRWHITLTRYLNQYLYTPLALGIGRRCARRGWRPGRGPGLAGFAIRVATPITLTMALAGIWHGSGPNFLAFGLLHAAYLTVNHAWRLFRPAKWAPRPGCLRAAGRIALTYACVLAGAVLFRAETLGDAGTLLARMVGLGAPPGTGAAGLRDWATIVGLGAIVFFAPNTQQIMHHYEPVLGAALSPARHAWRPSLPWAAALGGLAALGLLALGRPAEFLYFQF